MCLSAVFGNKCYFYNSLANLNLGLGALPLGSFTLCHPSQVSLILIFNVEIVVP